jgi:hypothetical protein
VLYKIYCSGSDVENDDSHPYNKKIGLVYECAKLKRDIKITAK